MVRFDPIVSRICFRSCIANAIARFPAAPSTKIKFEIYGHRLVGHRKHLAMVERTIQDLLDTRGENGGKHWKPSCLVIVVKYPLVVKLDLDTLNHANATKLFLKIKAVSDGNKEDMNEAVTQVDRSKGITGLPSMVADVTGVVQATDSFVQGAVSFTETWSPILDKLEALQRIGDCLSEVSPFIAFFILDISQLATKVHPYAKIAWSILNFIPKVKSISFENTFRY